MFTDTIIDATFEGLLPPDLGRPLALPAVAPVAAPADAEPAIARRLFKIRAADDERGRSSASILVNKLYASRGYTTGPVTESDSLDRITLVVSEREETIGTMSIGFGGRQPLLVEDLFAEEVAALRADGLKVCEFIKLALDRIVQSRRVLASLFHVAYLVAHRLKGFDGVVIEVNPRHVVFYRRMLGFRVIGPERLNRRVNAPAVALYLDFAHAEREIARLAGRFDLQSTERSLYPSFFSAKEESGILARLQPYRDAGAEPLH